MSMSVPAPPAPRSPRPGSQERPGSFAFGSTVKAASGRSPLLVPAAAFLVGALVAGAAFFLLAGGTEEAETPRQQLIPGDAPPAAWYDPEAGCRQVRDLEVSYGKDYGGGSPFSEVLWLTQLVNATEMVGANNFDSEGSDVPPSYFDVGWAADKLRMVTIGGGLSHPEFPRLLVELVDTCDRYFP